MHHSSKKTPPKHTPFLAYVPLFIDHTWNVCVWSMEQRVYVDSVMKQDIGNDFWWIVDLPEPDKLITANRLLSQDPELYSQLYPLLKEVLI